MTIANLRLGLYFGKLRPSPAPASIVSAIQTVNISQSDTDAGRQGFNITFKADRGPQMNADYPLLRHPLLHVGQRLVISVTLNAAQYVLMDGIIGHIQLNPPAGGQEATLTVTGEDLSVLLDMVDIDVSLPPIGHLGAALLILAKYLPLGIVPDVQRPLKDLITAPTERVPFQQGTDLDYLRRIAAEHSYIFMIKPGPVPGASKAYWGPPPRSGQPQKALSVNMGAATNVQSLDFFYNGQAATQYFGLVSTSNAPISVPIAGLIDFHRPDLSNERPLLHNQPFVRKSRLRSPGDSVPKAMMQAQTAVNQSTKAIVTAQGVLDVLKYGKILSAPGLVGVRGAGYTFDGNYYVQSVAHQISRGAYTQSFTLSREGPQTNVNKVII